MAVSIKVCSAFAKFWAIKTELLIWFNKIRKLPVWFSQIRSRHRKILNTFILHKKQANATRLFSFWTFAVTIMSSEAAHCGLLNTMSNTYKKVAKPWMKSHTFIPIQLLLANCFFNE